MSTFQMRQQRIEIEDWAARVVDYDRARAQQPELGMAEQTPGLGRQRCMDRQGVRLAQQLLEARGAVDAERQLDTVRQIGSKNKTRKLNALARNATAVPMRPSPMTPKFCTPSRRIIGW